MRGERVGDAVFYWPISKFATKGGPWAAIITRVFGRGQVGLVIFPPHGGVEHVLSTYRGTGAGEWTEREEES